MNALVGAAYLKNDGRTVSEEEDKLNQKTPPPALLVGEAIEKEYSQPIRYYDKEYGEIIYVEEPPPLKPFRSNIKRDRRNQKQGTKIVYYENDHVDGLGRVDSNGTSRKFVLPTNFTHSYYTTSRA